MAGFLAQNPVRLIDLFTDQAKQGPGQATAPIGRDLLERMLVPLQEQWDAFTQKIVDLHLLVDPFLTPRLEMLEPGQSWTTVDLGLWLPGLTDELEAITTALDDAEKRALRRSVAPLWKSRGLPFGWLRWISLLTGNPALHVDYFGWRYLTDEDFVGDGPVLLDPVDSPVHAAYSSDLYVLDPGVIMRAVITTLANRTRPGSERLYIRWVSALERWDRDFSGWARTGAVVFDEDDDGLPGAVATASGMALYTLFQTAAQDYVVRYDFTPRGVGTLADFVINAIDDQTFVFVRLDFALQTVSVFFNVVGVPVLQATNAFPVSLAVDVPYRMELSTTRIGANQLAVTASVDGEMFIDTTLLGFSSGNFGWRCGAAGDNLFMSTVMAFFPPVDYSLAAPEGAFDPEV